MKRLFPLLSAALPVLLAVGLLVAMVAALPEGEAPAPRGEMSPSFLVGGIQVNEPDLVEWTEALAAAGMNAVAVTDYARQAVWHTADLRFDGETAPQVAEIRAAREAGLAAVLVLRLALDHAYPENRFLWHGMVHPTSDAELDLWFERYGEFVLAWAEVAEREGVEMLFLGSELTSLTSTAPLERVVPEGADPAAAEPVPRLPELEDYYLDDWKQAQRRRRAIASFERYAAAGAEEREGELLWREDFGSFEEYLDTRIATERAWAERVTRGGDPAWVERRRARLEREWRELAARVREVYSGPIGYAANFDQYRHVGFWNALDVVGVNAYFPLRERLSRAESPAAYYPRMVDGWGRALGDLADLRRERGLGSMPVLFTEIGYTRRLDATLAPWAASGFEVVSVEEEETVETRGGASPETDRNAAPEPGGETVSAGGEAEPAEPSGELVIWRRRPIDLRERALAVRALGEALDGIEEETEDPLLAGLLWWKLSTVPSHLDVEPFLLLLGDELDPLTRELAALQRERSDG